MKLFNKKLILLLIFLLLVILNVSLVSAFENNETDAIEIVNNHDLSSGVVNDCSQELKDYDNSDENILDYNQGDKIPITIDSPINGYLTVMIDDEKYGSWWFLNNETIIIPTYNSESFQNSYIKNIDVGTHNMSLIFNFYEYHNYVPIISKQDSTLMFKFTHDNNLSNGAYTYTYNTLLVIHEIEKTIHVSFDDEPIYYESLDFILRLYNVTWEDIIRRGVYSDYFGIIISEGENIFYKENIDIKEHYAEAFPRQDFVDGVPILYIMFSFLIPTLSFDVDHKFGVCNITAINLRDGTQDSLLFNVSKFNTKYPDYINCIINENDATFYVGHHHVNITVSVNNIIKFISSTEYSTKMYGWAITMYEWNVTFTNLNPGIYVMNLYYPETDITKEFSYDIPFEIKGPNTDNLPSNGNITSSNMSYNMFPDMFLMSNGGFLMSNVNYGVLDFQDMMILDDSSSSNCESNMDGESISIGDNSGDMGATSASSGASSDGSNAKSYEISEKSHPKLKDDLLSKLGITLLSCMSFMVGYVRFEKH